jgi:hypothetical protein
MLAHPGPGRGGSRIVRRVALLFLDIDGTLLPFGRSTPPVGQGSAALRIDPRHGLRLGALPCEVVWATSWMEEANEVVAPVLGLPRLPVLDQLEPSAEDRYFGLHWKTRAMVAWAAGREFIWIDDEITAADREWVGDRHPGPALLLSVDPARGITDRDFDMVEAWLTANSGRPE